MPSEHICGVPGCKNKGTLHLPPIGPLRDDWYQILQLPTNSQSHRICAIHFDPGDLGKSGKKRRRDARPTRNLPLNSVSLFKQPTQFFLSYLLNFPYLHISFLFVFNLFFFYNSTNLPVFYPFLTFKFENI